MGFDPLLYFPVVTSVLWQQSGFHYRFLTMNKLVLPLCLDCVFLGLVKLALRLLRSPDTEFQIVSPGRRVGAVEVDAVVAVIFGATVATGRGNCTGLSCLLR